MIPIDRWCSAAWSLRAGGDWAATAMPMRCVMPWLMPCSGAVNLGDLGRHFPDTDPVWEGADSVRLLTEVVRMAAEAGHVVANADCTVIADAPRLAPYTDAMVERLTGVLGAPVSVKATRAEGLGALGRAEGIACMAVVLMEPA